MKLQIDIIKEAIDIIERNTTDNKCLIEQCNIILRRTREIKELAKEWKL